MTPEEKNKVKQAKDHLESALQMMIESESGRPDPKARYISMAIVEIQKLIAMLDGWFKD